MHAFGIHGGNLYFGGEFIDVNSFASQRLFGFEGCAPFVDEYQRNSSELTHLFIPVNGTTILGAPGLVPAAVESAVGYPITSRLTSTIGGPWEGCFSLVPCIPRSRQYPYYTTPTQVVNLNMTEPLYFWHGGLAGTLHVGVLAEPFTLLYEMDWIPAFPGFGTWQVLMFTPTTPDGFTFSRATQLNIVTL